MIFTVLSDLVAIDAARDAFSAEGFEVATFDGCESALDIASVTEPDLVLVEAEMSGMGGFELKEAYNRKYPNRITPFILILSDPDPHKIERGLDMGVDAHISKPVDVELLRAHIRAIFKRKQRYTLPTFFGDMKKLPFNKLMQFCEAKGLNGTVDIQNKQFSLTIYFKAGQVDVERVDNNELFKVYDLSDGAFIMRANAFDFSEMEPYALQDYVEPKQARVVISEKPMGRLSGINLEKRIFQIQTEFTAKPENQIVTIVVLDGRVINKKSSPIEQGRTSKKDLEAQINKQHEAVEAEIREKISALAQKKSPA